MGEQSKEEFVLRLCNHWGRQGRLKQCLLDICSKRSLVVRDELLGMLGYDVVLSHSSAMIEIALLRRRGQIEAAREALVRKIRAGTEYSKIWCTTCRDIE